VPGIGLNRVFARRYGTCSIGCAMNPATTLRSIEETVMRSLFPLVACGLLLLTPWIGGWALLGLTFVWWRIVTRIG